MESNIINFKVHPAVIAAQNEDPELFVNLVMNDPRHAARVEIRRAQDVIWRRARYAQRAEKNRHKFHLFGGKRK